MTRKQVTIYFDTDLIDQISTDNTSFNSRVISLVKKGLEVEQSQTGKDLFKDLLITVKALNDKRKNGEITFTEPE